jgi:hypothetical protein
LAKDTPLLLFQLLEKGFRLEAHSSHPGPTKESKALVVFLAKPRSCPAVLLQVDYDELVLRGAPDRGSAF